VDNFLTVDQVACLFDLVEHRSHIEVPLVESLIRGLLSRCRGRAVQATALLEDHQALHAVDLRRNTSFLHYHVAKLSLGKLNGNSGKLSKPWETDAGVVFLDRTNVVLYELPKEVLHVLVGVLGEVFAEGLKRLDFGFNGGGVEG
jgi:hypothetical protein